MDKLTELQKRDLKHIWHPCSQMKDYEIFPPIAVKKAKGPFLYTHDGKKIIDAISSWWCKNLGHGHPRIRKAVTAQMRKFEYVISANTCNKLLTELSEQLALLAPPLDKIFYADNGSTAVEVALKMSLQYHSQKGCSGKKKFLSFENGYHGETILALAAGDCKLYSKPFLDVMPKIEKLSPLPYLSEPESADWDKISEDQWVDFEKRLREFDVASVSAIIFEPVVQGAGGMKIYSPDLLRRLKKWASENDVHLIADEIMTGFGRTGMMLACGYAGIVPDFICLSKGLTAGWLPMSAVLTSTDVYDVFYGDYSDGKAFLHSNTYSGNALAAAAALEVMKIYGEEGIIENVREKSRGLRKRMEFVADETSALKNVRGTGFIAAADIINPDTGKAFPEKRRTGFRFYRKAVELGALLRPLGDTVYFLPPLNTSVSVLDSLVEIAVKALKHAVRGKI